MIYSIIYVSGGETATDIYIYICVCVCERWAYTAADIYSIIYVSGGETAADIYSIVYVSGRETAGAMPETFLSIIERYMHVN